MLCAEFAIETLRLHHLCDAVIIFKLTVVRNFIPDPETDQQGHGHTDRKPGDIDKGKNFVPGEIAHGDF